MYGKFCLVAPFWMGFRKMILHIKKVLSQKKGIDLNGNVCGFRQVSGYLFSEPVCLCDVVMCIIFPVGMLCGDYDFWGVKYTMRIWRKQANRKLFRCEMVARHLTTKT